MTEAFVVGEKRGSLNLLRSNTQTRLLRQSPCCERLKRSPEVCSAAEADTGLAHAIRRYTLPA